MRLQVGWVYLEDKGLKRYPACFIQHALMPARLSVHGLAHNWGQLMEGGSSSTAVVFSGTMTVERTLHLHTAVLWLVKPKNPIISGSARMRHCCSSNFLPAKVALPRLGLLLWLLLPALVFAGVQPVTTFEAVAVAVASVGWCGGRAAAAAWLRRGTW